MGVITWNRDKKNHNTALIISKVDSRSLSTLLVIVVPKFKLVLHTNPKISCAQPVSYAVWFNIGRIVFRNLAI